MKVNYRHDQLVQLRVDSFYKDVIINPDCGWKEAYVERFCYTTEVALPNCAAIAKVTDTKSKQITKQDYFVEKLTKFEKKYTEAIQSMHAVLPPKRLSEQWSMCVLGISTTPVLKMMSKIAEADKEGSMPYYRFVRDECLGNNEDDGDTPQGLKKLARNIWKDLRTGMAIVVETQRLNKPRDEDKDKLSDLLRILTSH